MPLSLQSLTSISVDVRYRLSPALESCRHPSQISQILTPEVLEELNNFFMELSTVPVTIELLEKTAIHDALSEMTEPGGGWPDAFSMRAERILARWIAELGSLEDIGQRVWGGRMKGCVKVVVRGVGEAIAAGMEGGLSDGQVPRSAWVIERAKENDFSLRTGHIDFSVGDWWVNPAAALRDGIIHSLECGISADAKQAFAIVLKGVDELGASYQRIKYKPSKEGGRRKLLSNKVSGNPVRVLRHYKLQSRFSPPGGLRYEGLYNVTGWGVRLIKTKNQRDVWQYTFDLTRTHHQDGIESALTHPNLEEMEDWDTYQKEKHKRVKTLSEIDIQNKDIIIAWKSKEGEPFAWNQDSGLLEGRRVA